MSKSTQYNRGIEITIRYEDGGTSHDIALETTRYEPHFEPVSESFENYDYSTCTLYKGDRFSCNIETGLLTEAQMQALRFALLHNEFVMICPEYPTTGADVRLTSISFPIAADNYGTKWYRINFAVVAVAMWNGNSL